MLSLVGVGAGLAALAVFTAAGCGRFFTGAAFFFASAADVGENEGEETDTEDDGFHNGFEFGAGLTATCREDAGLAGLFNLSVLFFRRVVLREVANRNSFLFVRFRIDRNGVGMAATFEHFVGFTHLHAESAG